MVNRRRDRRVLREVSDWWDNDKNRLAIIRSLAYLLFAASIAGTIYAAFQDALPAWAVSLYVAFGVQLVFLTFMYAIRHSGEEELRRELHQLRLDRVHEWGLQREVLAELARFAANDGAMDVQPDLGGRHLTLRGRKQKGLWPVASASDVVCKKVRESILGNEPESSAEGSDATAGATERHDPSENATVEIDMVAYSSETLLSVSREIAAEIEDALAIATRRPRIKVRVMVRDTAEDGVWLVPVAASEGRDVEYATELRVRFSNIRNTALKEFQEALRELLPAGGFDFKVRAYRVEPLIKGMLVDGQVGVMGFYTVDKHTSPPGWDYSGHGVPLCLINSDGTFYQRLGVQLFKRWFDDLWDDQRLTRHIQS